MTHISVAATSGKRRRHVCFRSADARRRAGRRECIAVGAPRRERALGHGKSPGCVGYAGDRKKPKGPNRGSGGRCQGIGEQELTPFREYGIPATSGRPAFFGWSLRGSIKRAEARVRAMTFEPKLNRGR